MNHIISIAAVSVVFFLFFYNWKRPTQKMITVAVNEYRDILQLIELWDSYENVFWVEQRIENFKSYSVNILDHQTFKIYCEKLEKNFAEQSTLLMHWEKKILELKQSI